MYILDVKTLSPMKKYILLCSILLTLTSCRKAEESFTETAVQLVEMEPSATADKAGQEKVSEQKIIKNGRMRFETQDLTKTSERIYSAVKKYQGQIQTDSEGKDYNAVTRTMVVRVPNENFENLVRDVSSGISYFDEKEISSQDVTEEFIDLEARLKAKKELENRYMELLKRAVKVSEILEIEKELVAVREEIEVKQGQLNYMQNRIAMSTLEIRFYKQTSETGVTVSYGSKMWNAVKGGVSWIPGFLLGMLYIWPVFVIGGLFFYILKKRKKRLKDK